MKSESLKQSFIDTWNKGILGKITCLAAIAFVVGVIWAVFSPRAKDDASQDNVTEREDPIRAEEFRRIEKMRAEIAACTKYISNDEGRDGSEEFFGVDFKKSMDEQVNGKPAAPAFNGGTYESSKYDVILHGNRLFGWVEVRASNKSHMPCSAMYFGNEKHDASQEQEVVSLLLRRMGKIERSDYKGVLCYAASGPVRKGEAEPCEPWTIMYYPHGNPNGKSTIDAYLLITHPNTSTYGHKEHNWR